METVIEVENLLHRFGDVTAVNGFDFKVYKGEVLGLLGPNGAGKTTTIRLINGLFPPTSGRIRVLGLDPVLEGDRVRMQTGVLTETPALYERLTAWQNLEFFGTLAGMSVEKWRERGTELLTFFDLEGRAEERVGTYSKGMKQRLALARALLNNPPLLFLDEPTAGLDPEAALQVHDLIASIRQSNGQTVVLCTHNLVEAQRLCDRLVVLNRGQMLAIGSFEELRSRHERGVQVVVELENLSDRLLEGIVGAQGVIKAQRDENSMLLQVESTSVIPDLAVFLVQNGARLRALKPQEMSLEEVYFALQNQAKGGV